MKKVGFARRIKLEWLDKVVEFYKNEKDVKKIKDELDAFLVDQVKSKVNRGKSIDVLISSWVDVPEEFKYLRDKAVVLFDKVSEGEKKFIHWFMLISAFPLFSDISSVIGKLLSIQEEFKLDTVRQRIFEIWGERSTVKFSTDKIISSMVEWGVLSKAQKPGIYKKANTIEIKNKELKLLFLEVYLKSNKKSSISYAELSKLYIMFPFEVSFELGDFYDSPVLNVNKMGDNTVIVI